MGKPPQPLVPSRYTKAQTNITEKAVKYTPFISSLPNFRAGNLSWSEQPGQGHVLCLSAVLSLPLGGIPGFLHGLQRVEYGSLRGLLPSALKMLLVMYSVVPSQWSHTGTRCFSGKTLRQPQRSRSQRLHSLLPATVCVAHCGAVTPMVKHWMFRAVLGETTSSDDARMY